MPSIIQNALAVSCRRSAEVPARSRRLIPWTGVGIVHWTAPGTNVPDLGVARDPRSATMASDRQCGLDHWHWHGGISGVAVPDRIARFKVWDRVVAAVVSVMFRLPSISRLH